MSQFNITQETYSKKILRSSYVTLATVLFLIIIKSVALYFTGSIIILSVLADSFFDGIISLTSFILVRISLKKSTKDFRFGFSKIESLASFLEGIVIVLISISILVLAFKKYYNPEPFMPFTNIGIIVLVVSLITTLVLVRYQTNVLHATSSLAVESERIHYISDSLSYLAAIVGLILVANNITVADPIVAILIGTFLSSFLWKTLPFYPENWIPLSPKFHIDKQYQFLFE